MQYYHELMTVSEVAVALRCGSQSVYKLLRNGQLVSVRRGRAHLIPREAVFAFIQSLLAKQAHQAL